MKYQKYLLIVITFTIVFLFSGCFSANPEDIVYFKKPPDTLVTADDYILRPPDEIEVICSKVPEIHQTRQIIRPDGMISFEAIGEVFVAGKTPKQVTEILKEKVLLLYALTGENPIDLKVVAYKSSVYYVIGQVYFEGPKIVTGRDSLLTALAQSRPTVLAWKDKVQVIRPSYDPQDRAKIIEVSYKRMTEKGDLSKNVLLEEGDIVYVPPTILASIGLIVEELVRPIGRAFSTVNIVEGPSN
ncbi:MAG: polysaccharide biosynthesis/export family protein [Phycisphaerae bacterium]|nr:polysaccharide biosynthesis/export family protein [Phycisphaerae bacterium]